METKKVIYVLELIGQPMNAGETVTFKIGGVSTDRSTLEKLKIKQDKLLDELVGVVEEENEEFHDDGWYVIYDTNVSGRPEWIISEYDLL